MTHTQIMSTIEKNLFFISFILAFLGISNIITEFATISITISGLFYLFTGWYFLSPEISKRDKWLPFIISYLIAQSLFTVLFGINNWPLKNMFAYFSAILIFITIAFLLYNKSKRLANYPINEYLIRLVICQMFSLSPIWML